MADHREKLIECIRMKDGEGRPDVWDCYRKELDLPIDLRRIDLTDLGLPHKPRLEPVDLSDCDLRGAIFTGLRVKHLCGSDLRGARLNTCQLQGAELQFADLRGADIHAANLLATDFSYAVFGEATVQDKTRQTDMAGAVFAKTNLYRATGLENWVNVYKMRFVDPGGDLGKSNQGPNFVFEPPTAPEMLRRLRQRSKWIDSKLDNLCSWENLRFYGQLPLFGASSFALIIIPTVLVVLAHYNHGLDLLGSYLVDLYQHFALSGPGNESAQDASALLSAVVSHKESLRANAPRGMLLLLVSTTILLFASSLLSLSCPHIVRQFTREAWVFEHGKDTILYVPASFAHPVLRVICGLSYTVGAAAFAIYVIYVVSKVVMALLYLFGQ